MADQGAVFLGNQAPLVAYEIILNHYENARDLVLILINLGFATKTLIYFFHFTNNSLDTLAQQLVGVGLLMSIPIGFLASRNNLRLWPNAT